MRPAQFEKKANAGGLPQLSQKLACDAGRSLVGVQHNLLVRIRVSRRCVSPSFADRIFEVEPLFVVSGVVSDPQTDICRDDIDGTMPQDEPSRL